MVLKTGWKGWVLGFSAGWLPLVVCLGFITVVFRETAKNSYTKEMLSRVIATQCLVSFPVVASVLVHLKIINTELGHLALASSLICNFIDISTSAISTCLKYWGLGLEAVMIMQSSLLLFIFLLFSITFVKPLSYWIIKQTPKAKQAKSVFIVVMCIMLLLSCLLADNIGLNHEVGAFIVGLSVPDGPPLGSSLVDKLEFLVEGLLIPVMVTYCGTKVDLIHLYDLHFIKCIWLAIVYSLAVQILSVLIPALLFKMPPRDALTISFVMSSQGIVQLSYHLFLDTSEVQKISLQSFSSTYCRRVLSSLYNADFFCFIYAQIFDKETLTMMVLSVLFINAAMDTLARVAYNYSYTYAGYKKRSIQHGGVYGELAMLTCMHHFDDVYAMKKLLEASIPDDKSSVLVTVLHLEELVGRANPQLIDHNFGQKATFSSGSRSQQVFEFFTSIEQQHSGLVHVHFFTGMSMFKFMHQDICSLAFKKSVSIIILPFHRKWNQQGKVISDNFNLRTVNSNVLEMAPCSVGILIDRYKIHQSSHAVSEQYRVALLFIGGADDREVVYYGKRMARSPGIHITVVRLMEPQQNSNDNRQWEDIMDFETLKDLKVGGFNMEYREEVVKDGVDTTQVMHEVQEAFDLILVGRRHNESLPQLSGLSAWSEFTELGLIGDIMATSDINKPVSILVVQQQITKR
ncbi:hypothetical protein Leryth_024649 [Lithospermum erythrorhizon]|nr:hypothetical protein Leryth_024649 [Lithospermum erythrorhizon]